MYPKSNFVWRATPHLGGSTGQRLKKSC